MDYSAPTPIPDDPRYGSGNIERCAKITAYYDPTDMDAFRAALFELEGFANELLAEGAGKLRFKALNILDSRENPEAKRWQLRVVGLRAKAAITTP